MKSRSMGAQVALCAVFSLTLAFGSVKADAVRHHSDRTEQPAADLTDNGKHFGHDFGFVRITQLDDRLFSDWEHRHAFNGFTVKHRHIWLVGPPWGVPRSISGAVANPEPATMLLFGTGLLAVGWTIRKKRRSTRGSS